MTNYFDLLPKVESSPYSKEDTIGYLKLLLRRAKKENSRKEHIIHKQRKFIGHLKSQRRRRRRKLQKLRESIKEEVGRL